ncbi:hypothetical protein T492DRAFT_832165 [Pavlovales sp. CCMP2436]|nr:hypothetical protein T492DRAFT_832165 [Pavlovales sp. CCMP2436]
MTTYVAFNVETTGFCLGRKDKQADEILSIGWSEVGNDGRHGEAFCFPIKAKCHSRALAVHRLSTEVLSTKTSSRLRTAGMGLIQKKCGTVSGFIDTYKMLGVKLDALAVAYGIDVSGRAILHGTRWVF